MSQPETAPAVPPAGPPAIPPVTPRAQAVLDLLHDHRSIRQFRPDPIDGAWLDGLLHQALQGGASSGNLNLVSVVKTGDPVRREGLYRLHSEQPMILQAPWLLTFCADTHRTRVWLAQRGARLGFADLLSWHTAALDTMLLAQTTALALEAHGLGTCYMGTTLFRMGQIAEFLQLPEHVLPVTTLVVGWPAEAPAQRDRLPAAAWIHDETYRDPTPEEIDARYAERDVKGWQRYLSMKPDFAAELAANGITTLAQYYTSPMKYDPDRFAAFSRDLHAALARHGFLGESVPPESPSGTG